MANRPLIYLLRHKRPLVLTAQTSVRQACRAMVDKSSGSVLVIGDGKQLEGIFTGRDAVRLLASGKDPGSQTLVKAATRNPVTIGEEARAMDALKLMTEGGFRHLPVIGLNGKLLGVISRGDLKGMEIEEHRWHKHGSRHGIDTHRQMSDVVKGQRPLAMPSTATVAEACAAMKRRKAGSALVVDAKQRIKGIFTGRDAVRTLASGSRDPASVQLAKAMTRNPVTLGPECRPIEALRAMCECGFRHVPVVDDGRILGVVSRNDFTGIEIDRLDEEEHLKECIW